MRFKGDVFASVYPDCDMEAAFARARLLLETYETLDLAPALGDSSVRTTVSIGIAQFPGNGRSSDDLVQCAYDAMFVARNAGGNRVMTPE